MTNETTWFSYKTVTYSFEKSNSYQINRDEFIEADEGTIFFRTEVPISKHKVGATSATESETTTDSETPTDSVPGTTTPDAT